jgi:hypothetical protein
MCCTTIGLWINMLKSDIFLSSSFKQLMIEIKHGRGVGARE